MKCCLQVFLLMKNGKELLVLIKKNNDFLSFFECSLSRGNKSAYCRAETLFFSMPYTGLKFVGFVLRTFVQLFGFKKEKNPTRF